MPLTMVFLLLDYVVRMKNQKHNRAEEMGPWTDFEGL